MTRIDLILSICAAALLIYMTVTEFLPLLHISLGSVGKLLVGA
jgi:hypothetical protein